MADRRIIILTEGHTNPLTAKTACSVLRYRPSEVVALLDSTRQGQTTGDVLGVGDATPIVGSLSEVDRPTTLLIGIAPMGGKLPAAWKLIVLEAFDRGMDVVSGLHDFLSADADLAKRAKERDVSIYDVRKNDEKDVSNRLNFREDCLRIHTVGQDCSLGKMVVSIEIAKELQRRGHDAKFVATGQTGIMIEGDGCPIDCVVSDFVNGAVEKLLLANQHHDILVFEGQGSLAHPRYSAVTAGLLHGCVPHGMIMCYEAGRETINGMPHVPLVPLDRLIDVYEAFASLAMHSKVIGVAVNSRLLSAEEADAECKRVGEELGLPVTDVFRQGAGVLVDEILKLQHALSGATTTPV